MTVRNLDRMFSPRSVALIGASRRAGSVGAVVARNLLGGGFAGDIFFVNPKAETILGAAVFPSIEALPTPPDLAVICTPPDAVPDVIRALGMRGTKAAVVITAGFGEGERTIGRARQQALLDAARPHLLRIVGPNCVGILAPGIGLNASFAHLAPLDGGVAFLTQSGAILTAILDWAAARRIGFSHVVSLGDMADVDFGDMLDYLANDPKTRAILLYIEGVTQARKFMSAARAAARLKPVVAIKAGRHAEGVRAASSHTGALAGSDDVYAAAMRRAGMLRVNDLEELFDAVQTLALARPPKGDRIAIVTNGGGAGVIATDSVIEHGGRLAVLSDEVMARLDAVLPSTWSRGNPIDIIGDADGERYAKAIAPLLGSPDIDALLVLNCPTAIASSADAARAVVHALAGKTDSIFTSWLGVEAAAESRRLFAEARIPSYETPSQAVRAVMHMVEYRRNQASLMETPPSIADDDAPDMASARALVETALADGHEWLTEPEAKSLLSAYRIPVVETYVASDPAAAGAAAARIGAPVALKILSPDITHKSDVGGVSLDLATPESVEAAAAAMRARVAASAPKARIDGFTVSRMVRRPHAYELIVGVTGDPQFGPMILFGQGGTAVEVINDKALALPPLNLRLARDLIGRTRIARLLEGFRDRPPIALDALALTLVRVSHLIEDLGDVAELDINPLLADETGVIALDARVRIARGSGPSARRFAIRPYPAELEETIVLEGDRRLILRPVRPEDEPAFIDAFSKLDPSDVRLRFFAPLKTLTHELAARLTQIDYDREMALVLAEPGPAGRAAILGVARMHADPDIQNAEFAVVVRSDAQGRGFGFLLMSRLIAYARKRGLRLLFGIVLRDNQTMLSLCRELGFTISPAADDPTLFRVSLDLDRPAQAASSSSA